MGSGTSSPREDSGLKSGRRVPRHVDVSPRAARSPRAFQVATGVSLLEDAAAAVQEAYSQILETITSPPPSSVCFKPSLMIVWCTADHNVEAVVEALRTTCVGVPFIGGTHSTGIFTQTGWHAHGDGSHSLGIFAIKDPNGFYVVGQAPLGTKEVGTFSKEAPTLAKRAAAQVMRECLKKTPVKEKPIGQPNGIWMLSEMDSEEGVLEGISDIIVSTSIKPCALCGGSSGNGDGSSNGQQFTSECGAMKNSVALALMYATANIVGDFGNAYRTISHSGVVTEGDNRQLKQIDGRPAADVYLEWNGGRFNDIQPGDPMVARVALHPMGRVKMYNQEGDPQYLLVTPMTITPDRGLHVLGKVTEGERLFQLSAADPKTVAENLVASIRKSAKPLLDNQEESVHGMIMACCAGYTTFVQQFDSISNRLIDVYGDVPFLVANTFGEQGTFQKIPGLYAHGNLMVSSLTFTGKRKLTDPLIVPMFPPTTGLVSFAFISCPDGARIREKNPQAYMKANIIMTHWIQQTLPEFRGYPCDPDAHKKVFNISGGMCFLVAVPSVLEVIQFCRAVQTMTMNLNWPEDVLQMEECEEELTCSGKMLFRGPKFRVSAHVGRPEFTFDPMTSGVIYSGSVLVELGLLHMAVAAGHTFISDALLHEAEETCSSYYGKQVSLAKALRNVIINKKPRMLCRTPFPCAEIIETQLTERDACGQ